MKRVKEMKLLFVLAALFLGAALFSGCGNATKESGGGAGTVPIEDAANVGRANCQVCHSALVHTDYSAFAGINSTGLPTAITHDCEACHGGGQYHFGSGPIPNPSPNGARCATCHDRATKVLASKHNVEEADNFDMIAGGHDEGKCQRCHTAEGSREFAAIIGAKTAYDAIVNYGTTPGPGQVAALPNLIDMSRSADSTYTAIRENHTLHNPTCATCHNPLTKSMVSITGWDPNNSGGATDQFDLCTSCHVYKLTDGTLIGSGLPLTGGAVTQPFYHDTAWYRVLRSTHYDNPATGFVGSSGETPTFIEGYVIRENSANPCFDCHGHELLTNTGNLARQASGGYQQDPSVVPTTHTDWSKSAHAGGLLRVKYASQEGGNRNGSGDLLRDATLTQIVTNAGIDDTTGIAWTHYNWDRTGRASCQRCHTATGASNFLSNPAGYNQANNNFSHLAGWTGNQANGSAQNEVLYCWGCHSSVETGALRNPGTPTYTYTNGATQTFPDVAGSNTCIACHSGRETGDSIKLDTTATPGTRSFINSHYLAAGGTVFTSTGYEYAGRNYNNVTYYAHDKIGTAAQPGTGSNGPCVGCHMSSANKHSFVNVTKDTAGAITALTSTVCASCHTGAYAMTTTVLNDEEHEYHASLDTLAGALSTKGIFYNGASYPYFFTDGTYATGYTTWGTPYGFAFYKETMGAAFNLNLLEHDPGGFAHNRYYSKGLIWDSIDFIDDGILNDSVPATINTLETATTIDAATAAAARTYLGSTRPGDASRIP